MTICCECKKKVMNARWTGNPSEWVCLECAPILDMRKNVSGVMFPFVTMHLNPEKPEAIQVQSLRHLRQLENKYGVQSHAFNMDERHSEPPRGR